MPTVQSSQAPNTFRDQMALKQADLQGKQLDIQREKIKADSANQARALQARAQEGQANREAQAQSQTQAEQAQSEDQRKMNQFTEKLTANKQRIEKEAQDKQERAIMAERDAKLSASQASHEANIKAVQSHQALMQTLAKLQETKSGIRGTQEKVLGDLARGYKERADMTKQWGVALSGILTPFDAMGSESGLLFGTDATGADINQGTWTGFQSTLPGRRDKALGTFGNIKEFETAYSEFRDQPRNNWWSEVKMSKLAEGTAATNVAYYMAMRMNQVSPDGPGDMAGMLNYLEDFKEIGRLQQSDHANDKAQALTLIQGLRDKIEKAGNGNLIQPFVRSMNTAMLAKITAARKALAEEAMDGSMSASDLEARQAVIGQMDSVASQFGNWVKIAAHVEGAAGGLGKDLDTKDVMRIFDKGVRALAKDRGLTPAEVKDKMLSHIKDEDERKALGQFLDAHPDLSEGIYEQQDIERQILELNKTDKQADLDLEQTQLGIQSDMNEALREIYAQ